MMKLMLLVVVMASTGCGGPYPYPYPYPGCEHTNPDGGSSPGPEPVTVSNLQIAFHTNDDDKDGDTTLVVTVPGVTGYQQQGIDGFADFSDHVKVLSPPIVRLSDLSGHTLRICIAPNGNDTWRFNYTLSGTRSDIGGYVASENGLELTQDRRCHDALLP